MFSGVTYRVVRVNQIRVFSESLVISKTSTAQRHSSPIMPSTEPLKKPGGRPRKYSTADEAAAAKRRQNRGYYHNPSRPVGLAGPVDFVAYEPLPTSDIPSYTLPAIGLRTSPDIPIPPDRDIVEDCEEELEAEAYLTQDNPPRTATPNTLHEEPEIIRQVEKIRTEEVTNIEDADYDAEVTARLEESTAHLEAAEVLQALRIGQQERQESSKAGSLYYDYAAQQFSNVESSAPRHNSTPIHSPPNTDIQQGSSPHTADTQRSHSSTT